MRPLFSACVCRILKISSCLRSPAAPATPRSLAIWLSFWMLISLSSTRSSVGEPFFVLPCGARPMAFPRGCACGHGRIRPRRIAPVAALRRSFGCGCGPASPSQRSRVARGLVCWVGCLFVPSVLSDFSPRASPLRSVFFAAFPRRLFSAGLSDFPGRRRYCCAVSFVIACQISLTPRPVMAENGNGSIRASLRMAGYHAFSPTDS